MLDDDLIDPFMKGLLGYGGLQAEFWFVGTEKGGGMTERELRQRLGFLRQGTHCS